MDVSIIICTWNRAALLRRALDSMRSLTIPPGVTWQVVVVNNNSTDETAAVLASFAERLPLTCVVEPVPGLSRSRNRGVAASSGDLLLFTDDDVVVEPEWMTAMRDGAARWPDATYFAGLICPGFAQDVPAWVQRHQAVLDGMLCARDLGPEPRMLEPGDYPWGPNMAVRRHAFARAGFDVRAGRIGKGQRRGSEGSLFTPLASQGATGAWVPAAKVTHFIPRARANVLYLLRYYFGIGRSAAQRRNPGPPPLHAQRRILADDLRSLIRHRREWPGRLAAVAWDAGRLLETRRLTALAPGRTAEDNSSGRTA
jgi:glycosyltransferase involved in cell wall biosynthesis